MELSDRYASSIKISLKEAGVQREIIEFLCFYWKDSILQ